MSINFSANQYENAFKTLKNWEVPKGFGCYPSSRDGFTQIIASDRGHLCPGVKRDRSSPWGSFVGTWDMPTKVPGNKITNSTARSGGAMEKLVRMKTEGDIILSGQLKRCRIPPPQRIKDGVDDIIAGTTLKPASPKPATPKSATGRLSGAREPIVESRIRSGAMNPVPASNTSPKSIEWPRPGASRMENAQRPSSHASKPPSPTMPTCPAEIAAAGFAANMVGTPEPELQALQRGTSPGGMVTEQAQV
ncbi:protein Flattop homolog [Haliotis rubra]|uniref:protein Flattop homolog n=1 Tax=Haliotis rubra TaxID=36100 RepID=UPI001EE5EC88|nr:protein Flattop homolog [Haliotis rubra]